MKVFCYFAIVIAFFMFYQNNPVYTVVVIGIIIGGYLYIKSRRKGKGGVRSFFSGRGVQQDTGVRDLVTLIMLQQMFINSNSQVNSSPKESTEQKEKFEKIEKVKSEILALLESD